MVAGLLGASWEGWLLGAGCGQYEEWSLGCWVPVGRDGCLVRVADSMRNGRWAAGCELGEVGGELLGTNNKILNMVAGLLVGLGLLSSAMVEREGVKRYKEVKGGNLVAIRGESSWAEVKEEEGKEFRLQVKKNLFSLESLSSYETLKLCICDMLLNTDGFHISTDLIEPLKERIAITVCDNFRVEVRTVGFEAEIQFQMVEECENDEDAIMEDIIDATMDIGPAMLPASKDSMEKLINTRRLEEDEEFGVACTVCLEELGLEVKVMPCGHAFHEDCIIKWLQRSHFCPLCRFSMPTEAD
ncbi:hypothetical protein NE237_023985 [Protea cynaroides]|uniref:RING-type domain-containing protein n=1 Tax=Protea cynaroides TaxID=273540 RepID=A0A9Q0HEZ6_9MAGN|nr:hypothetical protein NE237_023985 [Protea cynaroides]